MNEIVKLINKHEILTQEDLNNITITYINSKLLNDYFKELVIEKLNNCSGTYNTSTKNISIDRNKIIGNCLKDNNFNNYKIDYINYVLLFSLFHELTHVKQEKELREDNNLMMIFCKKYSNSYYKDLYHFFPNEREARIISKYNSLLLFQLSDNSNLLYSFLVNLYEEIFDSYYLFGDSVVYPFKEFYKHADVMSEFNYLTYYYDNLDLFSKLLYGLEISKEEYIFLNRIKNLLKNNFINNKSDIKKLILGGYDD